MERYSSVCSMQTEETFTRTFTGRIWAYTLKSNISTCQPRYPKAATPYLCCRETRWSLHTTLTLLFVLLWIQFFRNDEGEVLESFWGNLCWSLFGVWDHWEKGGGRNGRSWRAQPQTIQNLEQGIKWSCHFHDAMLNEIANTGLEPLFLALSQSPSNLFRGSHWRHVKPS